jgi:hypothetical protein
MAKLKVTAGELAGSLEGNGIQAIASTSLGTPKTAPSRGVGDNFARHVANTAIVISFNSHVD